MKANEHELTHEESLRIIQSMIDTAKNKISDNGFHFMLWGVLVIAASLIQFIWLQKGGGNQSNVVWIIMPIIGVPLALIYEWRKDKTERTRSHIDAFYGFLWLGFGIALALAIFTSVRMGVDTLPYILIVVGLATFISGCLFRFKPLILGGIVFWAACILASFLSQENQLLLNAASTFLGYILPGLLLWKNYQKQENV